MAELLERTSINGMSLANRFVRSATWEGLPAKDRAVTPGLTERMARSLHGCLRKKKEPGVNCPENRGRREAKKLVKAVSKEVDLPLVTAGVSLLKKSGPLIPGWGAES
jgi:hypothetical protein